MTRQAVRDYFSAFHGENVRRNLKEHCVIYVYLLIMEPFGLFRRAETWQVVLPYFMSIIPAMLMFFSISTHPMTLPKMFYLCPMSEKERLLYIRNSFLMKILFPVLAAVPLLGVPVLLAQKSVLWAVHNMVQLALLGTILGVDMRAVSIWDGSVKPIAPGFKIRHRVAGFFGVGLVLWEIMVNTAFDVSIAEMKKWALWLLPVQLVIAAVQLRFYRPAAEAVLNEENIQEKENDKAQERR